MSAPTLERQVVQAHTHTYKQLRVLTPSHANCIVAMGQLLAQPVVGLFGQTLHVSTLPLGVSRVYITEDGIFVVSSKMPLDSVWHPDPARVQDDLRLGRAYEPLEADAVVFSSLPAQGNRVCLGDWKLDVVQTTEHAMLSTAPGLLARLPQTLSLPGPCPNCLCAPLAPYKGQLWGSNGTDDQQGAR